MRAWQIIQLPQVAFVNGPFNCAHFLYSVEWPPEEVLELSITIAFIKADVFVCCCITASHLIYDREIKRQICWLVIIYKILSSLDENGVFNSDLFLPKYFLEFELFFNEKGLVNLTGRI